jgi:putative spermidine/putrescine transport system permease protein
MILPVQAALERVPVSLLEASADQGASRARPLRHVLLPLALPGVVAGSIFTFSLTLGDYIIPQIIGSSRLFIGRPSTLIRVRPATSRSPPPSPSCPS